MKNTIRVLALLLAVCLLTGCGASTKIFTCGELSMEVPSGMRDVSSQSAYSGYTFTLDSAKIAVFGLQETYEEYPNLEGYDLKSYATLVIEANGLDVTAKQRSTADYYYFDYTSDTGDGVYRYLVGCYQTDEGFWMVQVCSLVTNFELETFLGYLDSVSFS